MIFCTGLLIVIIGTVAGISGSGTAARRGARIMLLGGVMMTVSLLIAAWRYLP